MPLSRRYVPEFAPGESCVVGIDYSFVLPPSAVIVSGTLAISINTVPPTDASAHFSVRGPVKAEGRLLHAQLAGGKPGYDYQLLWTATDQDGNIWPRTVLMLCTPTS